VTGTLADGKAKLSEIKVQDGGVAQTYKSLDKVPEQYRDKAQDVMEAGQKEGRGTSSRIFASTAAAPSAFSRYASAPFSMQSSLAVSLPFAV